jgi:hypothetical protein
VRSSVRIAFEPPRVVFPRRLGLEIRYETVR